MEPTVSKHTIINLFEGRITALQKATVETWLQHPDHQELYFQWLDEWEQTNAQFAPDADRAFLRATNRASPLETSFRFGAESRPLRRLLSWKPLYAVAAAAVLILLAGFIYFRENLLMKQYATPYGQVETVNLPDGSRVTLNANSRLTVPRFGFGDENREVWLRGEAEFSVAHTVNHNRFVVRTPDQLEVQVLGTEFVVYSREVGSKVVLTKGSVRLRQLNHPARRPITIAPGDVVTLGKTGRLVLKHKQITTPHTAWKEHRFVFENTPLSDISRQLNEHFGIRITLPDSTLAQRTVGGTFRAETAADLLQVLSDLMAIDVQQTGRKPETYQLTASTQR